MFTISCKCFVGRNPSTENTEWIAMGLEMVYMLLASKGDEYEQENSGLWNSVYTGYTNFFTVD